MGDVFDDIKEVVAKHLPAVALDEFSKRLAGMEAMRKRAETAEAERDYNARHLAEARDAVARHGAIAAREAAVAAREAEAGKREGTQAVRDERITSALTRVADMKEVIALVFKSPEARSYMVSLTGTGNAPSGYVSGTISGSASAP